MNLSQPELIDLAHPPLAATSSHSSHPDASIAPKRSHMLSSMAEVASGGEDHGDAVFVAGLNDLVVAS